MIVPSDSEFPARSKTDETRSYNYGALMIAPSDDYAVTCLIALITSPFVILSF